MNYAISLWDYHNNKIIDLKSKNISINGEVHGAELKKNINGQKDLNFILPLNVMGEDGELKENFRWDFIKPEILVKLEDNNGYDWFIVKTLNEERADNGTLLSNIQCKHISNLLVQSGLDIYIDETLNASSLLSLILENSDWKIGDIDYFSHNGEEKIRSFKIERSNIYNAIQELAELFGGYPIFNSDKTIDFKKEIGENNGVVFRYGKNLKNIRRTIGDGDVITKLWVEGGSDDVGVVTISDVNPTGESYILNFDYFVDSGLLTQEQIDVVNNFQSGIMPINNRISEDLASLTGAYNQKSLSESILEGKTLTKSAKTQIKKEIDLAIKSETDTTKKNALKQESSNLASEISILNSEINTLKSDIASLDLSIINYENSLGGYVENKNTLLNNLNSHLSDFIREGLWQDTNYIDSQALFDDAQEQSRIYAYPQVSYDMSILDLSHIAGYEIEKFNLGDIIRIIDETLKIDTLGRITEISIPLDNPHNVYVQIGNYYSNFEDLFKKISQSAEIVKQRKEVYERATGINPDGTINYDLLQATFNKNKFTVMNGTNNNVKWDEKGITVTDLNDPNKMVRINAGGIYITIDGGATWNVGLSPQGLSALNITSGVIDTKLLQIWNSEQPRFKWSADGLYAFADNGSGEASPNKYIKFNQDGIFFTLDGGKTYEIEFGWNGLQMDGKAIKAGTLSFNSLRGGSAVLGGSGNGNGILSIRDSNNVEKILLNNEGIVLKNGSKLIGDSGVLNVLKFESGGGTILFPAASFAELGWFHYFDGYVQYKLPVNGYVPPNFTILEARFVFKTASIDYINFDDGGGTVKNGIRNIKSAKIYKASNTHGFFISAWGYETRFNTDNLSPVDRTSMIWGSAWTPTPSKTVQVKTGVVTGSNALSLFPAGEHFTFLIDSSSTDKTWQNSCYAKMEIYLIGYKS